MTDRAHMPARAARSPNLLCYEELIDGAVDRLRLAEFDENTASSLCYTSGTTGNPKGALYSHRSTVLHTYAAALPDALNCSARDAILPVVPMFHVNAWGLPYVGLHGRRQAGVPGPGLDGKSLYELFESERVTLRPACRRSGRGCWPRRGQRPEVHAPCAARSSAARPARRR